MQAPALLAAAATALAHVAMRMAVAQQARALVSMAGMARARTAVAVAARQGVGQMADQASARAKEVPMVAMQAKLPLAEVTRWVVATGEGNST